MILNKDLRIKIVELIFNAKEGHLPSSLSIVDIINVLYSKILKFNAKNINSLNRDYFILSKGHGCVAFYVVLEKFNIIKKKDLLKYGSKNSILGGHPDCTQIPGVESSTGSLGHGFPTAVGVSLGLNIQKKKNKVYCLLGDGECQEGTIWEAANIATNRKLSNICSIIDWNGSAKQLMPIENIAAKWKAFGWNVHLADGHNEKDLVKKFNLFLKNKNQKPTVIIAKTIKGKGIPFMQGHGKWHHKVPNLEELKLIKKILKNGKN
jgi:transketolase